MKKTGVVLAALAALPATAWAAPPPAWTEPVAPFRVVGNIYYVGSKGIAAYLITSPKGDMLLDGTLAANRPLVEANIARLGFRIRDVKILLNSHAHYDHAAALAGLKRDSGALLYAMAADAPILESGHIKVENASGLPDFPPVHVDHALRDGETVRLGPIAMTAVLTPGHTPGCTTWTTGVQERGRTLRVVFPCSITVAGNRLMGNRGYPGIVADFRRSFARLRAMKADVVLTAHPEVADVLGREARRKGDSPDAFIDPALLPKIVGEAQAQFDEELARQRAGG